MKKSLLRTLVFSGVLCIANCLPLRAQYVTIPDIAFVNWLDTNGFHQCLNGNQLDTTCAAVVNATSLTLWKLVYSGGGYFYSRTISNLEGIQYFDALDTLDCSHQSINAIQSLPSSLRVLMCSSAGITSIATLPATLTSLYCYSNQITALPALPAGLKNLGCSGCQITAMPPLPAGLEEVSFSWNPLNYFPVSFPPNLKVLRCAGYLLYNNMPALPAGLTELDCQSCQLTSLPSLPNTLSLLNCRDNLLIALPALPDSLTSLTCMNNKLTAFPLLPGKLSYLWGCLNNLTALPPLPASLRTLLINCNKITALPVLPDSLENLDCDGNLITTLPSLPVTLHTLWSFSNPLTALPELPEGLIDLSCFDNQLTSLPELPRSLRRLICDSNQLTSLPLLPDSLSILSCKKNPNLRCLPQLNFVGQLKFDSATITCVENYGDVIYSSPSVFGEPLCSLLPANSCVALSSSIASFGERVSFSVAPNPAHSSIAVTFETDFSRQTNFQLYDITGRMILQKQLTAQTNTVELSGVSKGMYLYSVTGEKERVGAGKLVVE